MVKLTTTNIVGSAEQSTWSQAQTVAFGDGHQLFIVLELKCENTDSIVDLATVGPEILSEIEVEGKIVNDLSGLQKLVERVASDITEGLKAELIIGLLRDGRLLLFGQGEIGAFLARGNKLAKLGMGIEGILQEDDVVVFSTTRFVEVVSLLKFKKIILEDKDPAEVLAPLVHTQSETSGVAAIVGIVKRVTEDKWGLWLEKITHREPKIR